MKTTFKEVKQKASEAFDKTKAKVVAFGNNVAGWAVNNPELAIATIPIVLAGFRTVRSFEISRRNRIERQRIERTYYDPSTGMHWDLKRKATNADRAEIIRRKTAGQDVYTILKQMNLAR